MLIDLSSSSETFFSTLTNYPEAEPSRREMELLVSEPEPFRIVASAGGAPSLKLWRKRLKPCSCFLADFRNPNSYLRTRSAQTQR